jgi:hypothetical protein
MSEGEEGRGERRIRCSFCRERHEKGTVCPVFLAWLRSLRKR